MPFKTLSQALLAAPADKNFVTMWKGDEKIEVATFGQFVRMATAHASYFQSLNLQPGDRVILLMPQGIPLMAAFAGAMLLGAIPAILAYPNFKLEPQKYASGLAGVTKNLQARLVVVDDEFPSAWLEHITLADGARLARVSPEALWSSDAPL